MGLLASPFALLPRHVDVGEVCAVSRRA